MDLSNLKSNTPRKNKKRIGRGGKRGTFSGHGTKGQKSRAGASVRPGFRGGDNRIWQLFPKQRGASKKPGGKGPHRKHRFFQLRHDKPAVLNLGFFNQFSEGDLISPKALKEKGLVKSDRKIKILGDGEIKRKISIEGFTLSKSARNKILKLGGTIK
ncbi:MAG: uL15 family ribosomal protein [bacterium]|nr:uL15 family ribosomal protein [bacterium]